MRLNNEFNLTSEFQFYLVSLSGFIHSLTMELKINIFLLIIFVTLKYQNSLNIYFFNEFNF